MPETPKGHGEKLARKQELAVAALLSSPTIGAAAEKVGVAERTLRNWMELPDFRETYLKARRKVVEQVGARIQQAGSEAVATLRGVMSDSDAPASARVTAARVVLELGYRGIELEDLSWRVGQLEMLTANEIKP